MPRLSSGEPWHAVFSHAAERLMAAAQHQNNPKQGGGVGPVRGKVRKSIDMAHEPQQAM